MFKIEIPNVGFTPDSPFSAEAKDKASTIATKISTNFIFLKELSLSHTKRLYD